MPSFFTAGLDETRRVRGTNEYIGVASYIFDPDALKAFNKEWDDVLRKNDLEYFHAYDWNSGQCQFSNRQKWTGSRRTELAFELVRIIKRHCTKALAVMVHKKTYEECVPEAWRNDVSGHIYTFALITACDHIAKMLKSDGENTEVTYLIEEGAENWRQADVFLRRIRDNQAFRQRFLYYSHDFKVKGQARSTEASDLFAWLYGLKLIGLLRNTQHIPFNDIWLDLTADQHYEVGYTTNWHFVSRTTEVWDLFGAFYPRRIRRRHGGEHDKKPASGRKRETGDTRSTPDMR